VCQNMYSYREAGNVKHLVRSLIEQLLTLHGEAWVVAKFMGNHEDDVVAQSDCGVYTVDTDQSEEVSEREMATYGYIINY